MTHKNIKLEVSITKLKIDLPASTLITLSLFLSFAKKSSQVEKQMLNSEAKAININHTLNIDYEQLDLSKHKYCLLFIYEISNTGRKKVIGNTPINILQANRQGLQILTLEECQHPNATVEVNVCLKFQCLQDATSSKASSKQKFGSLSTNGKDKKANPRYSDMSPSFHNLSRNKSPQAQIRYGYIPASKFEFRSQKNSPANYNLCGVCSPKSRDSNANIIDNNLVGTFSSDTHNILKIQQIEESEINKLSEQSMKTESLHRAVSNTSLQLNQLNLQNSNNQKTHTYRLQGVDKTLTFGAIGGFDESQFQKISGKISDKGKNRICPISIFDYIPSSKSSRLRMNQVISIKYMTMKAATTEKQENPIYTAPQSPLLPNLDEIALSKYLSTLQEQCRLLLEVNEDLTQQLINMKQGLIESQQKVAKTVESYQDTLQYLRQQLSFAQTMNEEYAQIIQNDKRSSDQMNSAFEKMKEDNNNLRDALCQKSRISYELKVELEQFRKNAHQRQPNPSRYPLRSGLVYEGRPLPELNNRDSYERDSESVFETFYDAKRTCDLPEKSSKSKPGRIVPNNKRNSINSPISRISNSIPASIITNQTGKSKANYSQVIRTVDYERQPKRGYFIDHMEMENEKKNNTIMLSSSVCEKKDVSQKKKSYFLNNKYIKEKNSRVQTQK